jgi:hypothetical protein
MARTLALLFGIIFLLVGILGFVKGVTPDDKLLGIFAVNAAHNAVHLAVGALGLIAAYTGWPRAYLQIIGIVYLLVGVLGFVPALVTDHKLLGIVHINLADNVLHLAVGAIAVIVGFAVKEAAQPQTS